MLALATGQVILRVTIIADRIPKTPKSIFGTVAKNPPINSVPLVRFRPGHEAIGEVG